MSIKLYIDYVSQPCRAILSLCKLGKIEHEIIQKRIGKAEHKSEEMIRLNPLKSLPFIIDQQNNDYRLSESHSIMRYICKTRKNQFKHEFCPEGIYEYLDWHHGNTRAATSLIKAILPENFKKVGVIDKETELFKLERSLEMLSAYFLKDKRFLCGNEEITIADLSAVCELSQLQFIDFKFDKYPIVKEWYEGIMKIKEIEESHYKLNELLVLFKKSKI